jgi:hypothetical protein
MSGTFDTRTPRRANTGSSGPGQKRSLGITLGVLGAGMLGGYGLLSASQSSCQRPPEPQSPEALKMDPADLQKAQQEYEQCRRRRSSSTASRGRSRSFFGSSSSRPSVSRGGFGRFGGSFGG